ncbi:MAG: U32 family peptidase [Bacilli bacterium]
MKLMACPNNRDIKEQLNLGVKSFLFGVKDFSINANNALTLDDIISFRKEYPNIELFLSMDKNLFNNELELTRELLVKFNELEIAGIFFYDQAILNIWQELALTVPLVWNQTHLVTNYNTCNYYSELGVKYGLLANEITLEEMLEIRSKSKLLLMVNLLGYPVMAHSKRKLLTNYFNYTKSFQEDRIYTLKEPNKDDKYLIKENNIGTCLYNGLLFHATSSLFDYVKQDFAYGIIYMENISSSKINEVITIYQEILKGNTYSSLEQAELIRVVNNILESNNTGFLYKKTIYKVKRNDK